MINGDLNFHIGMRKIKSLIAVFLAFVIWQAIRLILPGLEVHPIFAYIYAIIEIRDTVEKTKNFGKLRIKATFVGLAIGLAFVSLSIKLCSYTDVFWLQTGIELVLLLVATLLSLSVAEIVKCKNFCGVAAIITVICLVSHSGGDRYLYATMRVFQTLLGVFVALIVNIGIRIKTDIPSAENISDAPAPENTEDLEKNT